MKVVAIVLVGGIGNRMGLSTSKQLLKINEKYIIEITLEKFQQNDYIDEIIVVSNKKDLKFIEESICVKFSKVKDVILGGKERQDSVYNALKILDNNTDYVLIHDGVRPFVTDNNINDIIRETIKYKATTLGVPCKSTIKSVQENNIVKETLKREELYEIQTPQCFQKNIILKGYEKLKDSNIAVTDDATIVEYFINDIDVKIVLGSYNNIKITTKEDLVFSEVINKGGM